MATGKTNIAVLYGLICGGVSVVLTLVLYLAGAEYFGNFWLGIAAFAISIAIAVMGGLAQKKANGGYLPFSEALKTVFTIFVISAFISTLFLYILLNYIDEPFRQALAQVTAEKTGEMMKNFGAPQDQIDKATTDALDANNYSAKRMFLGFAFYCTIWFIFSLIIAAIIKRKRPEFENNSFNQ